MREINNAGIELIKKYEKFSTTIYKCPAGLATIGYGHVVKTHEDFSAGISELAALKLLYQDIFIASNSVLRQIKVTLNDNQYGALVSFTFNVGGAALERSSLKQKLNRGEYEAVPKELGRWIWAGSVQLKGLVRRRNEEGSLFMN